MSFPVTRHLLQNGADPRIRPELQSFQRRLPPLHAALAFPRREGNSWRDPSHEKAYAAARLMLQHGADPNIMTEYGTALHIVIARPDPNKIDFVKELVDVFGADINVIAPIEFDWAPAQQSSPGESISAPVINTLLVLEAAEQHPEMLNMLLLKENLPFDSVAKQKGMSPISFAAYHGDAQVVSMLLHHPKFDRSIHFALPNPGQSALTRATKGGHLQVHSPHRMRECFSQFNTVGEVVPEEWSQRQWWTRPLLAEMRRVYPRRLLCPRSLLLLWICPIGGCCGFWKRNHCRSPPREWC